MEHFIRKIFTEPRFQTNSGKTDKFDPIKDYDVHKHFVKFSKGEFNGPAIKISKTKTNIKIFGTYEFESAIQRFALNQIQDDEIQVKGVLMAGNNFQNFLDEHDFPVEWFPKKSTGQTKNYKTEFKTPVSIEKSKVQIISDKGVRYVNMFLSFSNADNTIKLDTKKKPPRPSKKGDGDRNINTETKFCTLVLPFSAEVLDLALKEFLWDFYDEVPNKFRSINIQNSYNIVDLDMPDRKTTPSREFRIRTVRIGTLYRRVDISSETFTKEIEFRS